MKKKSIKLTYCYECGSEESLNEHHIIPRSMGGVKTITLCVICHSKVHNVKLTNHSALTRKVLKSKKESGKVYSNTPYGFDRVGDDLVENKTEIRMMRKMFRLKEGGFNYGDISKYLTKNRKKTKSGGKWTPQNVYSVMKSHQNDGKITLQFS